MSYKGQYIVINDFSGGRVGGIPPNQLAPNQATDLDNIVICEGGKSFRIRYGNSEFADLNDGRISGIAYYVQADGDDFIVTVSENQINSFTYPSATPTNISGAVAISSSTAALYDMFTFNDELIVFGGNPTGPQPPFKWTGSGNCAALAGSPPTAAGGFSLNNRVFGYRTAADSSTIYWSILGNAEDWTGSGSGNATIGSLDDNQTIVAAVPFGTNSVIIFKNNSVYQMNVTSAPFPSYLLFDNIGTLNAKTVCVEDGIAYFLDAFRRLKATDGNQIIDFPETNQDLLNVASDETLLRVFNQKGLDYNWIVITNTSSGGIALVWDILNKCWLKHSTGYQGFRCIAAPIQTGSLTKPLYYTGSSDGSIYLLDTPTSTTDTYSSDSATVNGFWRSGWITPQIGEEIVQVNRLGVEYSPNTSSSTLTIKYGFNFVQDQTTSTSIDMVQSASNEVMGFKSIQLVGRGNYFQYRLSANAKAFPNPVEITKVTLRGKSAGQKASRSIA